LKDATQGGVWNLLAVCLRELRDFPINLLRTHLEKKHMLKILHSQPVRFAWKGALGFGLSFVVVNMSSVVLQNWLIISVFSRSELFFYEQYQPWFQVSSEFIAWTIASVIGGVLFAAFFSEKTRFRRFAILGALGWLIPGLTYWGLMEYRISGQAYLLNRQFIYISLEVLSGVFLGLMLGMVTKNGLKRIGLIAIGGILYAILAEKMPLLIWPLFPPESPLIFRTGEVYRTMSISWVLEGIVFGIVMGLILGWSKMRKPTSPAE
jgi:hypothetical protein